MKKLINREGSCVKREGFNNTENSRESLVSSRKFFMINKVRSTHNELVINDLLLSTKRTAFTMAEILLSLTIIGVVAAITLPSLTGNINERTWNTQRKALYARMSQAIALMPALNGYGSTLDNHSETFITNGLSKVLKINNICGYGTDGSTLFDCGLASQIIDINGTKQNLPKEISSLNNQITDNDTSVSIKNTKAAAFETANGESILTFYNPNCTAANVIIPGAVAGTGEVSYLIKQHVCANFIFDLNGKKGPNTFGKDVGIMSVVYSSDSKVVMPMYPKYLSSVGEVNYQNASEACKNLDEGQYRLPNIEELLSIYYNRIFLDTINFGSTNIIWSSTSVDGSHVYGMGGGWGAKYILPKTVNRNVICVER